MFSAVGEGWRETTLGEICEFQNGDRGKNYPSESKRQKFGIPFINAGHLTNRKIDFSEMDYISEETFNKLGSGKIRSGDILFCLRGSVGKFGSTGNLKQGAIASSLVILRAKEIARAGFILGFLDSENFKQQIESILTGAVQPNLSASNLKVVELHLPPLQVQDEILVMLDSFDRNVSIIEKLISETKRLRSGLLSELLSGEHEIPASYDGVMGAA
jgi:type I restriction enzyme S subunit